ncbi:MAG: hypothetical protein J1E85_07005 [Ruminococcus sp.]|nr:hypothetical protein [Ruminococcus sp.]
MKKLCYLLIVLSLSVLMFTAAGCSVADEHQTLNSERSSVSRNQSSEAEKSDTNNESNKYFVDVGSIGYYHFMYDKYTKIMYVEYHGNSRRSMTVLYNADDSVMTYDDWNNLE